MKLEPGTICHEDPDLGLLHSVVLPATSMVFRGIPIVQDIDHEILVVRRDASLSEIYEAIDRHHCMFGRPPRAVLVDWAAVERGEPVT